MGISPRVVYPDAKHKDPFEMGLEFQDFVCVLLAKHGIILQNIVSKKHQIDTGENLQGFEIKLDTRWTDTGRLSIEIAEKSSATRKEFVPSGIYRNDNSWLYIQGNYDGLFIFPKKTLILLHKTQRFPEKEMPTIKTFYLPELDAHKYCARFICPNKEKGINNFNWHTDIPRPIHA